MLFLSIKNPLYALTLSDSLAEHTIERRAANSGKRAPGAKSNSQVPTPPLLEIHACSNPSPNRLYNYSDTVST